MALAHSPRIVTNGLILCLDAGNAKSYVGSGVTWTDLTNAGTPMPNTGYFGGGGPSYVTTMDKLTYSLDTTVAVPGANLTVARNQLAATGSSTAGYFGGGTTGAPFYSTMDKVTYSTDTTAAVPGANLTVVRSQLAATGNSTAGYFGGGTAPGVHSTMEKVTYSSDTTAAVPGAFLTVARQSFSATGNSTAGYFGGGSPGTISIMEKVTYSTDTTAAVPGARLSVSRSSHSATGSSTAGYFGGGFTNAPVSTMDKVTYSTDTTAAVPGAFLTVTRRNMGATGSSIGGYFGGGNLFSTMEKVTYSTDTTAEVPGAALSVARQSLAASSARANALPGVDPIKNKLTLINGPTYTSAGGGYLTFNGTDQRATFTIPDLVNYSMSFWVYIISLPASGEEQLFSVHNDYIGISLLYTLNAWKWQSWNASAVPSGNASRVGSNVSTGTWYNFVMTRAEQTTKFYINNSLTDTFSNGGDIISGNAYFCSFNTGTDRNLNARLSNVCFYDRELSAAEVSQNFSALRGRYGI